LPSQNFRVKNGLEVGTGVTISATGIISATSIVVSGNSASTFPQLIVSGVSTFTGPVSFGTSAYFGDNDALHFGDSNDLQIVHDGSNSYVADYGTGRLVLASNGAGVDIVKAPLEYTARFFTDGAVELYHDNSKKFETLGAGVTVTGTTFTSQLNVSGISTLGNTVVGGATTQLIVNGNARITGILTIGTSSITFNGSNDSVTIGTGVTIFGNTGIVSATEFRGNGANLTGVQPFPSGTLMLFQQTAAPTGWTKQTTHNDKTLRVVSGSASSGGTTAFSSVMTSRTPSGSVSVSGSNSGGSVTGSVTISNAAVTLTSSQIPSHSHTATGSPGYDRYSNPYGGFVGTSGPNDPTYNTGSTGGGGSHTHANTASWSQGTFTNPTWSGSASFSGTALDFAVQYVDLIIASKN
jgi:hypothetical protein